TLDLTSSAIASNELGGFGATISGLNVGSSNTTPTNDIDLANLSVTSASLNTSTDVLTVTTAGGSFNLQLSGTYASGTYADYVSDGASGTDIFLSTEPQPLAFHSSGTNDSWNDPASWGGTVPSANLPAGQN